MMYMMGLSDIVDMVDMLAAFLLNLSVSKTQTILFSLRCILCNSVHFLGWWFSTWKSSEAELALAAECALAN